MKTLIILFCAGFCMFACAKSELELDNSGKSTTVITPRTSVNELEFLGGLSGVGTYNSTTNEWVMSNMTGDIQFRPYLGPTWYNYTGKRYTVTCTCGSSGSGCTPIFYASDIPTYECRSDSCSESCEMTVTVTETEANGGAIIATYSYGGEFRPKP